MPTEVISTLKPSGGHYTSVGAWIAANQAGAWVTNDQIPVLECYRGDYTALGGGSGVDLIVESNMSISAWTDTDATRRPIIRMAVGEEHNGKWDGGLRWKPTGSWNVLFNADDQALFEGLIGEGINEPGFIVKFGAVCNKCIAYKGGAAGEPGGFKNQAGVLQNCLSILSSTNGFYSKTWYSSLFYNCISIDAASVGFAGSGTTGDSNVGTIKNCVVYNSTGASFSGGWHSTSTANAADDGATVTPPGTSPYTSNVVVGDFVDPATNDYHLASGSGLIGQGVNLTTDFTNDIDEDTRPATGVWDIGFDEFVALGGGIFNESLSFVVAPGLSISPGLILSNSLTLSTAPLFLFSSLVDLLDSISLSTAPTLSLGEKLVLVNSLNLSNVSSFSSSALVEILETALMSTTGTLESSNTVIVLDSISLSNAAILTTGMYKEIFESFSLTHTSSFSSSALVILEDFITIDSIASLSPVASLVCLNSISLLSANLFSLDGYNEISCSCSFGIALPYVLIGTTPATVTTPDSVAADITGDLTLLCHISPDTWTPLISQVIISKYLATANQRSYEFRLQQDGKLSIQGTTTGALTTFFTVNSTIGMPTDRIDRWAKVTFDVDDGFGNHSVKFWESIDGLNWNQLGSTVTSPGVKAFWGGTSKVFIGKGANGALPLLGKIHAAQIREGITGDNGTLKVDFQGTDFDVDGSWVSSTTGEIWTAVPASSLFVGDLLATASTEMFKENSLSLSFSTAPIFTLFQAYEANVNLSIEGVGTFSLTSNAIQNISLSIDGLAVDVWAPTGSINESINLPASALLNNTGVLSWIQENTSSKLWTEDQTTSNLWTEPLGLTSNFTED